MLRLELSLLDYPHIAQPKYNGNMGLFVRLVICLTVASPTFAYSQPVPPVLNAHDVNQLVSSIKSVAQILKIIDAYFGPADSAQIKKYLADNGVTEKTPLPKITIEGTQVKFAGIKGEFDFKNIAAGKIGNGHSVLSFNQERPALQNLKAAIDYFKTGNYGTSLIDLALPCAEAEVSRAAGVAGTLFVGVGVMLAGAALILAAAPEILPVVTVAAISLIFFAAAETVVNSSSRMIENISLSCENGELGLVRDTGGPSDLAVEDFTGPIERGVRGAFCDSPRALAELNKGMHKMFAAIKTGSTGHSHEASAAH
jgi:hypothetical protein